MSRSEPIPPTRPLDVIVVGAGLAGLSAAAALQEAGTQALILEAGTQAGGRVRTRTWENVAYDVGALFAFDPAWLTFPLDPGKTERADAPIGLWHQGQLHAGDGVENCLQALQPELRHSLGITPFLSATAPQAAWIGEDLQQALQAFLRVIHPADLESLLPERRADSLVRHDTRRFRQGNSSLIDGLQNQAGNRIQTGCRVVGLSPGKPGNRIGVRWQTAGGGFRNAEADRVVLAVPPTAALQLCAPAGKNVATDFLGRVRFGTGIVVILLCRGTALRPFSYIVSTSGKVNTFLFHRPEGKDDTLLVTAYLVAEQADAHWTSSDTTLAEMVRGELNTLGIGQVATEQVVFVDIERWPEVGPVVDEQAYGHFSQAQLRPMPGVVLAGDYTWCEADRMPYGMAAAIASGRRAARFCLGQPLPSLQTDYAAAPLATTVTSRITDHGPAHRGGFTDGTIAYYGLILAAEPELAPELAPYLIGEADGDLWAYQQGYGVTSLDSALVMEGLLAVGGYAQQLERSALRLVEIFFDPEAGAFWTIALGRQGRAPYWQGPDCPATAACAWLLSRIDGERYREIIAKCQHYLLRNQRVSGGWPGKWFPSCTLPIWYAVRFLVDGGKSDDALTLATCRRAAVALTGAQGGNGSWGGSVIETAAAVLALNALRPLVFPVDTARMEGLQWLAGQRQSTNLPGEPILEYWFEDNGQRVLHHTRDRGRITAAWATLALRSGNDLPHLATPGDRP